MGDHFSTSLGSLAELVRTQAEQHGDRELYRELGFLAGTDRSISFAQLWEDARRQGAYLQSLGLIGKRAVLLFPPGLDYIAAFFACIVGGVVAVPAYPPDPTRIERTLPRLRSIIADSQAEVILTTSEIRLMAEAMFMMAPELRSKGWHCLGDAETSLDDWVNASLSRDSLAFLQYTSGSTGEPKGVMLSHGNLLHNLGLIGEAFQLSTRTMGMSWLPPYHDMGLIGGILGPLGAGCSTGLMSPIDFLKSPVSWLSAITRLRATVSGGPNFAYELCVRKVSDEDLSGLDLGSWELAFSGAEPVRAETIDRFYKRFEPAGFRLGSFYPCYGLAESTLIVTGHHVQPDSIAKSFDATALSEHRAELGEGGRNLVSSGTPVGDLHVRIVDPMSRAPLTEGRVGEIWVAGGSVAEGYWNNPGMTERVMGARIRGEESGQRYLRTGDLGFLQRGEVYIAGRLRDIIIIRGRNLYPQDVELTAERSHPALRRGCSAAFGITEDEVEGFGVAVEAERRHRVRRKTDSPPPPPAERREKNDRRRDERDYSKLYSLGAEQPIKPDFEEILTDIHQAVILEHGVAPTEIYLVKAGSLPKTSSGKIQRSLTKKLLRKGAIDVLASRSTGQATIVAHEPEAPLSTQEILSIRSEQRISWLTESLTVLVARALDLPPAAMDPSAPLTTLGLDSVGAVQLAHQVEKRLGALLPAAAFLRDHSIRELAQRAVEAAQAGEALAVVGRVRGLDGCPVSAGQNALYWRQVDHPEDSSLNVAIALRLSASFDIERLRRGVSKLVQSHSILRVCYEQTSQGVVHRFVDSPPQLCIDNVRNREHAREVLGDIALAPFEMGRAPFRAHLLLEPEGDGTLVVAAHHIAVDLWSMVLMLEQLKAEYLESTAFPSSGSDVDYSAFVQWERSILSSARGRRARQYWQDELERAVDSPLLAFAQPRRAPRLRPAGIQRLRIQPHLMDHVRRIARGRNTTPFVVLISSFLAAVATLSGESRLEVATPTTNREPAEFGKLVGYFVNLVTIRADLSGVGSIDELLERIKSKLLDGLEAQFVPFSELWGAGEPHPDIVFAVEKAQTPEGAKTTALALGDEQQTAVWGGLRLQGVSIDRQHVEFGLSMVLVETEDALFGTVEYDSTTYPAATISMLVQRFERGLEAICADSLESLFDAGPDAPPDVERTTPRSRGVEEQSLAAMVFDAGRSRPQNIAVEDERGRLCYGELLAHASRVARDLQSKGLSRGDHAVLALPPSRELVVAQLACMMTRVVFVPVDPSTPAGRVESIYRRVGARLLLGHAPVAWGEYLRVDLDSPPTDELFTPEPAHVDEPTYVLFTSGSTGEPKGAMIHHGGLLNLVAWHHGAYRITDEHRGAVLASSGFDASIWEIWPYLTRGAALVARDGIRSDVVALRDLIDAEKISHAFVSSPMAELLIQHAPPRSLERLLTGADRLTVGTDGPWSGKVVNHYGPTECSVVATAGCVPRRPRPPHIGTAIGGVQVDVIDDAHRIAARGAPGQLQIRGAAVGLGYAGEPRRTAEAFRPVLGGHPGEVGYHTGDRVRWLEDGNLDFLGRRDRQVKLRGNRVELGEITAVLQTVSQVSQCAVAVVDGLLVAFVVGDGDDASMLRAELGHRLPAYMIPSEIHFVRQMPITRSGKIDYPTLLSDHRERAREGRPLQGPLELLLGMIVKDVAGIDQVAADQDLIATQGLHSLSLAKIRAQIRAELDVDVPIGPLLESPSIEVAARLIRAAGGDEIETRAELIIEVRSMSDEEVHSTLTSLGKGETAS